MVLTISKGSPARGSSKRFRNILTVAVYECSNGSPTKCKEYRIFSMANFGGQRGDDGHTSMCLLMTGSTAWVTVLSHVCNPSNVDKTDFEDGSWLVQSILLHQAEFKISFTKGNPFHGTF